MPAKEPLTPESIERAYYHLRKGNWTGGLQAALDDPIRGRFIRGIARLMQSGIWDHPAHKPSNYAGSTVSIQCYKPRYQPMGLDFKSKAAGEREDD